MKRVTYTRQARQDLDEIAEYLAARNLDAGIRFCWAIEKAVQQLAEMPGMGRPRDFVNSSFKFSLRSWGIPGFANYLLFYRPINGGIEVIRIVHGARYLESLFNDS